MNDKFIETVISRAGVVRVRNALNAMLWVLAICLPLSLGGIYLFRDDTILRYGFMAGFVVPVIATITAFFWLLIKDPNRLQSEEFVLRQQELTIKTKALPSTSIERNEIEDILVADAAAHNRERRVSLMKVYLLVFDTSQATRDEVIKKIDGLEPVVNWQAFFENTVCLVSDEEARSLSRLIRAELPKLRFLLSEVNPLSKAGWLPKSIWEFLNDPKPAKADA